MHYTSLQLKNFRSYKELSIELSSGINIVVGPNASGKTNLLEAVLMASQGSSFRSNDRAMIKQDEAWFKISATTNENHNRTVVVKLGSDEKTNKEFKIDNTAFKRMTRAKTVPVVLFEPEHLRMITGSPEKRRDYLDGILSQTEADYKSNVNRYKKALAQRNRLLKTDNRLTSDDMFVWDVQLSEYGAKINQSRHSLVGKINDLASKTYSSMSGKKTKVLVEYDPGGIGSNYSSSLLKNLQQRFDTDRIRGFTTIGPHREDMRFHIDNKEASVSASRGETRSLVLMCKVIELDVIAGTYDKKPIILLDDVFSELDGARRRALTEYLKGHQTIITTTDADAIIKSFLDGYNVIATG